MLAERIGTAIGERRRARGMSAVQLSARTAEFGYPITRGTIAKIESNSRGGKLDLAEIMVLAAALDVPPILLIFPDGPFRRVEVLPEMQDDSIHAAMWFTGEWYQASKGDGLKTLCESDGAEPIELMRRFISSQRIAADLLFNRLSYMSEGKQADLLEAEGEQLSSIARVSAMHLERLEKLGYETSPYSPDERGAGRAFKDELRKRGIGFHQVGVDPLPKPDGDDLA